MYWTFSMSLEKAPCPSSLYSSWSPWGVQLCLTTCSSPWHDVSTQARSSEANGHGLKPPTVRQSRAFLFIAWLSFVIVNWELTDAIPLHTDYICSSTLDLMDIWVVSTFWLILVMLLQHGFINFLWTTFFIYLSC